MLPQDFFSTLVQLRFCRVQEFTPSTSVMQHSYLGEAVTAITLIIQSAVTAFMLAYAPASRLELLEWTLLPMIGATIASGGAFCLNTQIELRRTVIGRCLFAMTVGVVGPRLMSMTHPWISDILNDPLLKVGAGFAHGFLGYILSWPVVKSSYTRATPIASALVQSAETQILQQVGKTTTSETTATIVTTTTEAKPTNTTPQ